MNYILEHSESGVDTGVLNTTTQQVDVGEVISMFFSVKQASGNIQDAVIELQISPDGNDWYDSGVNITFGVGDTQLFINNSPVACRYIRLKVTTKSTAASTADIDIQGK